MKHIRTVPLLALAFTSLIAYGNPDNSKSKTAPADEAQNTKSKTENLPAVVPGPSVWMFENGNMLTINPSKGIEFVDREYREVQTLFSGRVYQYPRRHEDGIPNSQAPYPFSPSKIAFVEIGGHPAIITQTGKIVRLPFEVEKVLDKKHILMWSLIGVDAKLPDKTTRFYALSLAYAPWKLQKELLDRPDVVGSMNYGETFIIREDGELTRLDYRYHGDELKNIHDANSYGYLFSTGSPYHRAFDLLRFEEEKEFVARPIAPILSPQGAKIDPVSLIPTFARNLSQEIADDVTERNLAYEELDAETRDVFRRSLARIEMNSLAVLGPAGTGKTEMIKMFIAEVNAGLVPDVPRSTIFLGIEAGALGAGTMYRGSNDSRAEAIIAMSQLAPVVLVMDEIHSIKGSGASSSDENDIFETLKPHIASGRIKIWGMSTKSEFNRAFGSNKALYERFMQMHLKLPTKEAAIKKASGWTKKHRQAPISPEMLEHAYYLSEEFNAIGAQPRKMILLLIEAYADLKISKRFGQAPTMADLNEAARRIYHLNPSHFSREGAKSRLSALPLALDAVVAGQAAAKESLIRQARISIANAHAGDQPRLIAALVGPEGTGKTALAQAYGDAMGITNRTIMLGQYDERDGPTALLRDIKEALQDSSFTNFVLDEADKANPKVLDVLLPILNSGRFILPAHKHQDEWVESADVSALNASFIFAGNFATDFAKKGANWGFTSGLSPEDAPREKELRKAVIADGFSKYILDRVTSVDFLDFLTKEEFRAFIDIHLEKILVEQTRRQQIPINAVDQSSLSESLANELWREEMSNRDALRLLNKELRLKIANAVMAGIEKPAGLELDFNSTTKAVDCESIIGGKEGA